MRTVVVVGAALAGWRAAQELREQGFTGRLVLVGAEERRPYDRQPLSKEFLTGNLDSGELALDGADEEAALDAEWRLGVPAIGLDSRSAEVVLADGSRIHTDGVVLATGAERATLPGEIGRAHV